MNNLNERLSSDEEKAIETFVQRLQAEFGQELTDVRLYGSKARGEARSDSDLDILVLVTRSDYPLKHAILWLAAEISLAHNHLFYLRNNLTQNDVLLFNLLCDCLYIHPISSSKKIGPGFNFFNSFD